MVSRKTVTGVSLAVTALLAAAGIWLWQARAQRAAIVKRYQEALAASKDLYIDEKVCADCHQPQAAGHPQTGHAETFHLSRESAAARSLDGKVFEDPERSYQYHYAFNEQEGLSVAIPKQFGEERFPLPYVLGSGRRAMTFLTLIPDRLGDATGIEHRVSLYPGGKEGGWEMDLTPGHKAQVPTQDVEHFGSVIKGDTLTLCVACHTTSAVITSLGVAELRANIGCQNCHGPGREHVLAVSQGESGGFASLRQQGALAEIQLCGRCHRLPNEDVDPADSLHDIRIVRFQPIGLLQSRCFEKSGNTLGCSTCHDPHQPVSRDAAHYERRCLDCHRAHETAPCPVSPRKDCVVCHMPAVEVHRGIEFHDHWIRVRPEKSEPAGKAEAQGAKASSPEVGEPASSSR